MWRLIYHRPQRPSGESSIIFFTISKQLRNCTIRILGPLDSGPIHKHCGQVNSWHIWFRSPVFPANALDGQQCAEQDSAFGWSIWEFWFIRYQSLALKITTVRSCTQYRGNRKLKIQKFWAPHYMAFGLHYTIFVIRSRRATRAAGETVFGSENTTINDTSDMLATSYLFLDPIDFPSYPDLS